ncbi:MAG TPA: tRNA lysidine(34) synthetase TilS [Gallionellaceae bacterium]
MASSRKSISDLCGRVADALDPVVPHGSSLLVGLSGGLDSVVLLHVLAQLAPHHFWRLGALHVHHGISPHADAWAAFCTELCAHHSVPLQVEHVDIAPLRDMGIEAAARQLRHAALARQAADFIALAHHRDDQAETLLLQLLRGAGVRGGSAMPLLKKREDSPALLRPLLDFERGELEHYARAHGLEWVEDESNADVGYPRNFLRHRVLPVLAQRFPAYRTTLARSARHFAEAAELLDELAAQDAVPAMQDDRLSVQALRGLGAARGKNLLRHFLAVRQAPIPDHTRLGEMLRQLCEARADAQLRITWQGWQLRCFRAHAYVLPQTLPPCEFALDWQGEAELTLPASHGVLKFEAVIGQGISRAKLQQGRVQVRSRHGDVSIQPAAVRPHRSLRNLLQEQGVPPWQRELLPLLYCGDELVGVPGVAVSAAFQAQAGEPGIVLGWESVAL